ncbi:MAG: hypothetical protein O7G88_20850 [bacterium]|nr:hypothetical protein [bacterium]
MKTAEEVKRKLEAKLKPGEFALLDDQPSTPSFDEYAVQWLATYATHNCKESTYTRYDGVVRNDLIPAFGSQPRTDTARDDIKQLI